MNKTFNSYLSYEAALAGASALAYAYFFVVAANPLMYSFFLLMTGLFSIKVMVGLYLRLMNGAEGFALLGLIFGVAGSMGMAIHGGYDLANAINTPAGMNADLPSQVDPRGMLAFGAMGFGVLYFSWLMSKKREYPKNLSILGFVAGVMLVWIYLARLIVMDPTNPLLLYPVLITGFVLNPVWYLWLAKVFKETK